MSLISLRNRLNREAVEEDYRANKKVMERQLKQVEVMGEPLRPTTSDEAVLGSNLEKFLNAFLNKLEQLDLIIPTITEDFATIRKGKVRKQLAISGFIIDWNAMMEIYSSPTNTENQRTLLASNLQQLQNPINNSKIILDNTIQLIAQFIYDEAGVVGDAVYNILIEIIKVRSLLNLFLNRLKSNTYKRINSNDIKSSYYEFIKNPPIATFNFNAIFEAIPKIYETMLIGKPLQDITQKQKVLLRKELADIDEEDETEIGSNPLSQEEEDALNYQMGQAFFRPPTPLSEGFPVVSSFQPEEFSRPPSPIQQRQEAGPSGQSSDFPFDDISRFNSGEIAMLKRYWFNQKDDAGTPYEKKYIENRILDLEMRQNLTEYNQAQLQALRYNLNKYHTIGNGKMKGKGLYSSRKIVFSDGKERPINTRFRHISTPMDYIWERDDPYGNYRLE